MELLENDDPLPEPEEGYKIALVYNLKKNIVSEIEDIEAEYDNIETVHAIKEALENFNCKVQLIEADNDIFARLLENKPDLVFNIAEGICGRGREAQVPAILNFLRISFTGSDETTLCIALDKALAKRILSSYGIKTPAYRLLTRAVPAKGMRYPVIVKPNAEGSSKGISDFAVAENADELAAILDRNINMYNQPMLVEEFIRGREFTVGLIGNNDELRVFQPMEIKYKNPSEKFNIYSYNVKKNYKEYVEYSCPAEIDEKTGRKMMSVASRIYRVLECRDFARIDFRMSPEGEIYFIEINPLPGLAPGYSDYPMLAGFCGVEYRELIGLILNSGLKRYGMKPVTQGR